MSTVGIIANPSAGKDIRRLVTQARVVSNEEKINVLRRVLKGLAAIGVERVICMPDSAQLIKSAGDKIDLGLEAQYLDMPIYNEERDSSTATEMMVEMDVGCLVTLGGDGTNRAVAKNSARVPLIAISTGTNNVFPSIVEGTVAGMAAGVVARGLVNLDTVTTVSKRFDIEIEGGTTDIALVDVAVSRERFVGARAIWDIGTVNEVFLTRADPANIGLSAVGAQLRPISMEEEAGIYIRLGKGWGTVKAPVGPGTVASVSIAEWHIIPVGESREVEPQNGTVALDGERSISIVPGQTTKITLCREGPTVVSVEAVMREAYLNGVFKKGLTEDQ